MRVSALHDGWTDNTDDYETELTAHESRIRQLTLFNIQRQVLDRRKYKFRLVNWLHNHYRTVLLLPLARLTLHSTKLSTKYKIFRKKYFWY
jgi:hypothetical protein